METPRPVLALILILPSCPEYEKPLASQKEFDKAIVWLNQTINNACGLWDLHTICNASDIIGRKYLVNYYFYC